jgi:hypothetical protein
VRILVDDNWRGSTYGVGPHTETKLNSVEHIRIVKKALHMFEGQIDVDDSGPGEKLIALKEAYDRDWDSDFLYIMKGIHQPTSNPHMQLKLEFEDVLDNKYKYLYHLDVSASEDPIQGLSADYFHWVGVRFSATKDKDNEVVAYWPKDNVKLTMKDSRRRMSIAPINVQGKIEQLAAEAERERQEQRRRLKQAETQNTRNAVGKLVDTCQWLVPQNVKKNTLVNELADGKEVNMVTKAKKLPVKVKYDGRQLKLA